MITDRLQDAIQLTIPLINPVRHDRSAAVDQCQDFTGNVIPFANDHEDIIIYFAKMRHAVERAKMTREIILRMNKIAELRDPKETGPHVNRSHPIQLRCMKLGQ
jgi:hypothetical protein